MIFLKVHIAYQFDGISTEPKICFFWANLRECFKKALNEVSNCFRVGNTSELGDQTWKHLNEKAVFLPWLHFLLEAVSLTPFSTFIPDVRLKLLHLPNMDWIIAILLEFRTGTNHRKTGIHLPLHYNFELFYHQSTHSWLDLQIYHDLIKAMNASNGLKQNWAYEPSTIYQDCLY